MIANDLAADAFSVVANGPAVEWPCPLEQALSALPKRCVFRNDRVTVLLCGLKRNEAIVLGPWPHACLLVVTFGRLNLVTGGHRLCLQETDSVIVVPAVRQELQALDATDFLLFAAEQVGDLCRPLVRNLSNLQ